MFTEYHKTKYYKVNQRYTEKYFHGKIYLISAYSLLVDSFIIFITCLYIHEYILYRCILWDCPTTMSPVNIFHLDLLSVPFMEKFKGNLNNCKYLSFSWIRRLSIIKMSILSKLAHYINVISISKRQQVSV